MRDFQNSSFDEQNTLDLYLWLTANVDILSIQSNRRIITASKFRK